MWRSLLDERGCCASGRTRSSRPTTVVRPTFYTPSGAPRSRLVRSHADRPVLNVQLAHREVLWIARRQRHSDGKSRGSNQAVCLG